MRQRWLGEKAERAPRGHEWRESVHLRVCLQMKVAKHFVGSPPAQEFDDVSIDFGAQ
jgi:hypothetical protein